MSIQHKIAATLAPAIDCNAPYAKVMIAMLVEVAEEEARRYVPEIERLKVWVADLQGALKPFADYAERIAKDHPGWDHDAFDFQLPDCGPTMRAFRAARAALGKV